MIMLTRGVWKFVSICVGLVEQFRQQSTCHKLISIGYDFTEFGFSMNA